MIIFNYDFMFALLYVAGVIVVILEHNKETCFSFLPRRSSFAILMAKVRKKCGMCKKNSMFVKINRLFMK